MVPGRGVVGHYIDRCINAGVMAEINSPGDHLARGTNLKYFVKVDTA